VIPPARAREIIRAAARHAVERAAAGELPPYQDEKPPYSIEVELRQPIPPAMRENLSRLHEFRLVDERTVACDAEDMDIGFRRIAYLTYAERPGALRY
jgi:D-aminopeptidase